MNESKYLQLFAVFFVGCMLSSLGRTWCLIVLAIVSITCLFAWDEREVERRAKKYDAKKD